VARIAAHELLDAAFLKAILCKFQGNQPGREQDATKIARERAKLEAERQRLLRLTLKGTCTEADFERESKRIEAELRSLDSLTPTWRPEAFDPAKLVIRITRGFARFPKQPFGERRGVLQAAVREVVVEDSTIPALTLNGSFLAGSANLQPRYTSRKSHRFRGRGLRQSRPWYPRSDEECAWRTECLEAELPSTKGQLAGMIGEF